MITIGTRPALYGLIVFAAGIATGHWLARPEQPPAASRARPEWSDPRAALAQASEMAGTRGLQRAEEIGGRWALESPELAYRYAAEISDPALAATFVSHGMVDAVHAAELVNAMLSEQQKVPAARAWIQSALERRDPTVADFESRLQLSPAARAELDAEVR